MHILLTFTSHSLSLAGSKQIILVEKKVIYLHIPGGKRLETQ